MDSVSGALQGMAAGVDLLQLAHLQNTATLDRAHHYARRAIDAIAHFPASAAKAACGDGYRELPDADQCCGGAGAFAFVHEELSEELLKKKIARIASVGAKVVAASSTGRAEYGQQT